VARLNHELEWVIQEALEMRIVDLDVWDAVKARQNRSPLRRLSQVRMR
jgi:hypothetical protein